MFVDCLTIFDILKLLSESLFCLKKVLEWQSWLSGPKTPVWPKESFPVLVSTQTFSSLWQILDVAKRGLLYLGSWVPLLRSDQSIACRLSKLLFWCLSCIRLLLVLLTVLWIFEVLVPNQSKDKGTCTSFLTNRSEQTALNFFPRELKNMHLLSLVCTCTLLFATCISDFSNLPFWRGNMGYMHSFASNL